MCKVKPCGSDEQSEACQSESSALCQDKVDARGPGVMSRGPVTDEDVVHSQDVTSSVCHEALACISLCEENTSTRDNVHSVVETTDDSDKCQSHRPDRVMPVVASNAEHCSHLYLHPSAHSDENVIHVVNSTSEHHLSASSESDLSVDSASCGISSIETESNPAVGFSQGEAVHCVDDMQRKHENQASTETETETVTRNTNVESPSQCAVSDETLSATDALCTTGLDKTMSTLTDKLSGKPSGIRCILTASVSDIPQPVAETVAHIGSTHIHITDELSVVNGVVQLVESAVKIGELSVYVATSVHIYMVFQKKLHKFTHRNYATITESHSHVVFS